MTIFWSVSAAILPSLLAVHLYIKRRTGAEKLRLPWERVFVAVCVLFLAWAAGRYAESRVTVSAVAPLGAAARTLAAQFSTKNAAPAKPPGEIRGMSFEIVHTANGPDAKLITHALEGFHAASIEPANHMGIEKLAAYSPIVGAGGKPLGVVGVAIPAIEWKKETTIAWWLTCAVAVAIIASFAWGWITEDTLRGDIQRRWQAAVANEREIARADASAAFSLEQDERTAALEAEIERRKQAQKRLAEVNRQISETARLAGMAEVASGVLHNVGNVLNSINVSTSQIHRDISSTCVADIPAAIELISANRDRLAEWLDNDERGTQWINFMELLAEQWQREHARTLRELRSLVDAVSHAKDIVNRQQALACTSGMMEAVSLNAIVDDALKIEATGLNRHNIRVERELADLEPLSLDKVKLMQILVNLIRNAREAMAVHDADERRLKIMTRLVDESHVNVEVTDTGIGIAQENFTKLFAYGFTTKKDGHGFGLHSSALAAREMGGELIAESPGRGHGATFSLVLPIGGPQDELLSQQNPVPVPPEPIVELPVPIVSIEPGQRISINRPRPAPGSTPITRIRISAPVPLPQPQSNQTQI